MISPPILSSCAAMVKEKQIISAKQLLLFVDLNR